ncbi:MAG: ABC transporter substrate-binding protein [Desulfococcaceae bacterium]
MKKKHEIAAFFCFILLIISSAEVGAKEIMDMSGRKVIVPDTITKVYCASPPATYMLYAVDPALIAGLNYPFNPKEQPYLNPAMARLPVIGGWFGQGRTPNQETLLQIRPDIMIVWKWKNSAVNEKIEQTAQQLKLPLVYIQIDRLSDYSQAFQFMGGLLHREDRAQELSDYAAKAMKSVESAISDIPDEKKVSVYYAEAADGLSTECDQSVHAELIPLAGGKNIHQCKAEDDFGMVRVSIEQVMLNNPDVIIAQEKNFADQVFGNPIWQSVRAVKNKRVHLIPKYPFNWFDRPPSFMRLLGIRWLTHLLYPDRYAFDLSKETKAFYKLFLGIEPDDRALEEVLQR